MQLERSVFVQLMRVIQCVYRNGTLSLNVVRNCRLKITRQFHYRLTWVRQLNTLIFWNADNAFPGTEDDGDFREIRNDVNSRFRGYKIKAGCGTAGERSKTGQD